MSYCHFVVCASKYFYSCCLKFHLHMMTKCSFSNATQCKWQISAVDTRLYPVESICFGFNCYFVLFAFFSVPFYPSVCFQSLKLSWCVFIESRKCIIVFVIFWRIFQFFGSTRPLCFNHCHEFVDIGKSAYYVTAMLNGIKRKIGNRIFHGMIVG